MLLRQIFLLSMCLLLVTVINAQDAKDIESRYATFSKHKKFFAKDKWAMVKFQIIYKLTTAKVTKAMDKNDYIKSKSSSGSYGILEGITEEDLQNITDQVAENFIRRMKEEAGVEVITWGSFADSPNTSKIKEKAEERELYSKSQGLGYAMSYDGTPYWNKVIQIVPGGKKLAKELGANNGMLSIYIDFADTEAEASAFVSSKKGGGWITHRWSESADQNITPIVRVKPNMGSQNAWEAATSIGGTSVGGQTELLHSWNITYAGAEPDKLASDVQFATKVEAFAGQLPTVLQNRSNNKIEYVKSFVVQTTPEKYGAAVMDATNKYFDDVIGYYNLTKP